MQTEEPASLILGHVQIHFILGAHPVGGNNQEIFGTAGDVWHMLADLLSIRQRKVVGVGEAAMPVEPSLVSLAVQRLKSACVTSADGARLCYLCWRGKMVSRLLAWPSPARQVASAWLLLLAKGWTSPPRPLPTSDA